MENIQQMFPLFYNNEIIKQFGKQSKWSISTKDKMPIDMYILKTFGIVRGCCTTTPYAMCTLDESIQTVPYSSNHAYFLDCLVDKYIVLDIEKICKPKYVHKFMQLPYVYAERSLSKKGRHLLLPLPRNFDKFPIAKNKVKLQEPKGQYELLMDHWVTFTRDTITSFSNPTGTNLTGDWDLWDELYENLATQAKKVESPTIDYDNLDNTYKNIPRHNEIINILVNGNQYQRTPQDFLRRDGSPDMSRYEAGFLTHKYNKLRMLLATDIVDQSHDYDTQDQICLLAEIARRGLEHRAKHDQKRVGLPYLVYIAKKTVEHGYQEKQTDIV